MLFNNRPGILDARQLGQKKLSMAVFSDAPSEAKLARASVSQSYSKFSAICTYRRFASGDVFNFIWATSPNRLIWRIDGSDKLDLQVQTAADAESGRITSTDSFDDLADWHTVLAHVDVNNATAGDRFRMWHDGVEVTSFSYDVATGGDMGNDFSHYYVGSNATAAGTGLIFQAGIVSGSLVDAADVYDTVNSRPKDLRNLSGLAMLPVIQRDGTLNDLVAGVDWTTEYVAPTTLYPELS